MIPAFVSLSVTRADVVAQIVVLFGDLETFGFNAAFAKLLWSLVCKSYSSNDATQQRQLAVYSNTLATTRLQ